MALDGSITTFAAWVPGTVVIAESSVGVPGTAVISQDSIHSGVAGTPTVSMDAQNDRFLTAGTAVYFSDEVNDAPSASGRRRISIFYF